MDAIAITPGPRSARCAQAQSSTRAGRDVTPYGQKVEDNIILELIERARAIQRLPHAAGRRSRPSTQQSRFLKKGLALTPVKFGISFTLTHLNQAGALVHVYTDGSVHLNHGGTEMGQGLYVKVAQVVAEEFGIGLDRVKITATTTDKVPNTSPTAASSGSDLNGMAAKIAAATITQPADRFRRRSDSERAKVQHPLRERPGDRSATSAWPSASWPRSAIWRACRCPRPASTPRRRSLGPGQGERPSVLLLRLWRRLLGGHHRHADRRDAGRPRRYPPRCRPLAQSGGRHRPDRGRLRPGHGLADHRGTGLRRRRAAPHPCAFDLQDPHAPPTCRPISASRSTKSAGNREDTIYRSKAVGEPPLMLAHLGVLAPSPTPSPASSRAPCRRSTHRRRRKRSCGRSTR